MSGSFCNVNLMFCNCNNVLQQCVAINVFCNNVSVHNF